MLQRKTILIIGRTVFRLILGISFRSSTRLRLGPLISILTNEKHISIGAGITGLLTAYEFVENDIAPD